MRSSRIHKRDVMHGAIPANETWTRPDGVSQALASVDQQEDLFGTPSSYPGLNMLIAGGGWLVGGFLGLLSLRTLLVAENLFHREDPHRTA